MTAFDPTKRRNLPFPLAGANTADRSPVALPGAQGAPQAPEPANVLPRVPVEQPAAEPVMPLPDESQAKPTLARANAPGQTQSLASRFPGGGKSPAQTELERVQQRGTGIHNIHNPVLKTLATIGDVLAGTFAQRAEMLIPGTEGHHALELARAGEAVKGENDAANQQSEATLRRANAGHLQAETDTLIPSQARHFDAEATEVASRPGIAEARQEGVNQHNQDTAAMAQAKLDATAATNAAREASTLAQHGFQKNPNTGEIEPLPYEKMSQDQQAVHELKAAQADAASAQAELARAKAQNQDGSMAAVKLQQAQQRLNIASQRLGLSSQQFEARTFGTNNGQPIEGALTSDRGKPVGSNFQANVRPTGTERGRADLADSAQEQLQDMRAIIARHPEFFGPGAGRKQEFESWWGSLDPDAKAFQTASTILGEHGSGVFGARSEAAAQAQKVAAGEFKNNPDAIARALDQMEKAFKNIGAKGTMRTVGSNAAAAQPVVPPPATSVDPKVKAYADQYFKGDVKAAQAAIEEQRTRK